MNEKTTLPMSPAPQGEEEIDLMELAAVLLQNIRLLAAVTVLGAVLAFAGTKLFVTPRYTASSMVYIFTKTTSITSLADMQLGTQLTADFTLLATSRPVVERVIEELELDTSYEKLLPCISVENKTGTRIIKISATNPDPELAADISNAMSASLCKRVAEVMNTEEPSSVETAIPPKAPSSPRTMRNAALGGMLCLLFTAGVLILLHLLDDTIQDEEDVRRYLGLETLASVPREVHPGERRRNRLLPPALLEKLPMRKRA